LLAWLQSSQKLENNVAFSKDVASDPFMEEAMRVFPGLSPADTLQVTGLGTTLDLTSAAAGIKQIYQQLLDKAWADAKQRGDKLPPISQKDIPPTVPGQQ
jgi:hypothetical protein